MERAEVLKDIFAAIGRLNEFRRPGEQIESAEETRLYGDGGALDSLALVALILDVEETVGERAGVVLVLADDRAVAQRRSPFRDVRSLADHVLSRLEGASG